MIELFVLMLKLMCMWAVFVAVVTVIGVAVVSYFLWLQETKFHFREAYKNWLDMWKWAISRVLKGESDG